jgi:eukaryotic-like serine/threonine-protein kinase
MKRLEPGTEIDGFLVGDCLHSGGMAHIYSVTHLNGRVSPFPLVMKVPRMTTGDGAENIISFEIEHQILQTLQGQHVPRFVAAGDLAKQPYLVMEHVPGQSLQQFLDSKLQQKQPISFEEVARIGAALAQATHSLHLQNVCHLDLKPANVLMHPQGHMVLLDFGLSHHAHFPDLLAEQMRKAVGSPTWIAPEQVVGTRGDPRSDVFAIGVILYELLTGELAFGNPQTAGGMRQRLWMSAPPPKRVRPDTPDWLQEIILHCLHAQADERYPSAAHLAFDLLHPNQVQITALGKRTEGPGFWRTLKLWVRAAGMEYEPSPIPAKQLIERVPIVMVALPHEDVDETILYSMRIETERALGNLPGARLAVVSVASSALTAASDEESSEIGVHRLLLTRLQRWAKPLERASQQCSYHVLEASDIADTLLKYAKANHASILIMGAATHGLQMQRFVATIPTKVAMQAPCTVMLVKGALPFEHLHQPDP